jgi:hypothetical protein
LKLNNIDKGKGNAWKNAKELLGQRKTIQQDVEVQGHNMCNPSWHVPVTALHVLEIRPTHLNTRILEI